MDFSSSDEAAETVLKGDFDEVVAERASLQRQVDELREKLFMAMSPQPQLTSFGSADGVCQTQQRLGLNEEGDSHDLDALLPEAAGKSLPKLMLERVHPRLGPPLPQSMPAFLVLDRIHHVVVVEAWGLAL